jgi:transposase
MTPRKKYSKEFKLDAISLVLEQGQAKLKRLEACLSKPIMLRNWIKEHHKVVGWSMSSRMQAQLVCDALTTAIW